MSFHNVEVISVLIEDNNNRNLTSDIQFYEQYSALPCFTSDLNDQLLKNLGLSD